MAIDSYLKKRFEFVCAKLDEQKTAARTAAARTIQSWFRLAYRLKQHALTIQTWYRRCIHCKQQNAACRIQRFIRKRAQIRDSFDTRRKWRPKFWGWFFIENLILILEFLCKFFLYFFTIEKDKTTY